MIKIHYVRTEGALQGPEVSAHSKKEVNHDGR